MLVYDAVPMAKQSVRRALSRSVSTPGPRNSRLLAPESLDTAARFLRWLSLAMFLIVLVRTAWLCDDAYITFRVVDNAAHGYGLRWNVDERVQAFTSPLWTFALIPGYLLTGDIYSVSLVLCIAASLAAAWIAGFCVAASPATGVAVLAILVSSRAFVDYSTSGLENALMHLVLAAFAWRLRGLGQPLRSLTLLAGLGGLVALCRHDAVLLVVPALAWMAWSRRTRREWAALALGFVPFVVWTAFSLLYYGFAVPNTAYAKLATGVPASERVAQGWHYLGESLRHDPLTLSATLLFVAIVFWRGTAPARSLACGAVLYLGYVVIIGGDFMSGRFLAAPLLVAVLALSSFPLPLRPAWGLVAAAGAVAVGLLSSPPTLLSGAEYGLDRESIVDVRGVADERAFYFPVSGWLNGLPGPKPLDNPVHEALAARRCGHPLAIKGAVGYFGFFAGPGVHVVDFHGLGDPLLARLPAVVSDDLWKEWCRDMTGKEPATKLRVGHFRRIVPTGYVSHLLGRDGAWVDPRLGEFARRLDLVTKGPLFSGARLAQIVRFNLRLDRPPSDFPTTTEGDLWAEAFAARPGEPGFSYYYGKNLLATGNRAEGLAVLRDKALVSCPNDAPAALFAGFTLMQMGHEDEGVALLERATRIDPRLAPAQLALALAYLQRGETARAIPILQLAARLSPLSPRAYAALADAYETLGRDRDAQEAQEQAARRRPYDATLLLRLGELCEAAGQRERAADAWRRAAAQGSDAARKRLTSLGLSSSP